MINKILLLACDRPEYLTKCIVGLKDISTNIFCLLDKPANAERLPLHHECKEILRNANIDFDANAENLGCTNSMFKLLSKREMGDIILILEDDIILKDNANIKAELDKIDNTKPFILKLNSYFWGWVANFEAIELIEELRTTDVEKEGFEKDELYMSIRIFQQENVKHIWDEFYQMAIKFCGINCVTTPEKITNHIGDDSSRGNNEIGEKPTHVAWFKDGKYQELKTY